MSQYQYAYDYPGMHSDDRYEIIGYVDASGIEHESFEAACVYYGCDTPSQLAYEAQCEHEEWACSTPGEPRMATTRTDYVEPTDPPPF